jgi:hypothetical protein
MADLRDLAEHMDKGENFYVRLFTRAYDIEMTTQEIGEGLVTNIRTRRVVKDDDLAQAYELLVLMRKTLGHCANQFKAYGTVEKHRIETEHLTLVEKQDLQANMERNLGIAGIIESVLADTPEPSAHDWKPIATAPQSGRPIRLLGKREDGSTYIETGRWANIVWSVVLLKGLQAPTHWAELEALPEGYA